MLSQICLPEALCEGRSGLPLVGLGYLGLSLKTFPVKNVAKVTLTWELHEGGTAERHAPLTEPCAAEGLSSSTPVFLCQFARDFFGLKIRNIALSYCLRVVFILSPETNHLDRVSLPFPFSSLLLRDLEEYI